jgi:hypothetical protein
MPDTTRAATVYASSREDVHALVETAMRLGDVTGLIHAAGVSPTQASPATILKVDLYGTALVRKSSATLLPSVALASSSRRNRGTAYLGSRPNKARRWP